MRAVHLDAVEPGLLGARGGGAEPSTTSSIIAWVIACAIFPWIGSAIADAAHEGLPSGGNDWPPPCQSCGRIFTSWRVHALGDRCPARDDVVREGPERPRARRGARRTSR